MRKCRSTNSLQHYNRNIQHTKQQQIYSSKIGEVYFYYYAMRIIIVLRAVYYTVLFFQDFWRYIFWKGKAKLDDSWEYAE